MIMTLANHPAPMYVSAPTWAIPAKLVKDTVYMPSSDAARLLGPASPASAGRGVPAGQDAERGRRA